MFAYALGAVAKGAGEGVGDAARAASLEACCVAAALEEERGSVAQVCIPENRASANGDQPIVPPGSSLYRIPHPWD
jgi:hypothetical protein